MLISQAAMSPGAIGCPSLGPCAEAGNPNRRTKPLAKYSRIDIADLALLVDAPTCNGVVMVEPTEPTLVGKLRACGLYHAAVVGSAALQNGWAAVPLPR